MTSRWLARRSLALAMVVSATVVAHQQTPPAATGSNQTPGPGQARLSELQRAVRSGDVTLLRSRLQEGADPNARDAEGRTLLIEAVSARKLEAASTLLTSGAGVNARSRSGRTALIEAAEQGDEAIAGLLIENGADLNLTERGWGSALEVAERMGHEELAARLRRAGARRSGRSVGDTVCVRPWNGDGYCGVVETVRKATVHVRVTELVGCDRGCAARAECSAGLPVGGAGGVRVGDLVSTTTWCLTHTGVTR
jgi:Ankyrin repeats (3 copies)